MDGSTSSETKAGLIHAAILAVMKEVGVIGKTRENERQNYKFRGIDDVVERVGPLLAKHGIICYPSGISDYRCQQVASKGGGTMMHVTCVVDHTYEAADGSKRISKTFGEAMDSGDKASNKAMSGALKYAHCEVFEIATFGKDADSESQSPELAPRTQSGKTPTTAPASRPATRPTPKPSNGPANFPNYGRAKGAPIAGASKQDLDFYANGARRSLGDPAKSNFHAKEQALLDAINAEIARRQSAGDDRQSDGSRPGEDDQNEPPPHTDDDQPF
jgi:hypothetical protein